MPGRRSYVNSLWTGSERVRIGERLKATLAGIMELDLLRSRQLEMVDGILAGNGMTPVTTDLPERNLESTTAEGAAASLRQQVPSPSELVPASTGEGLSSRWSTLSWDIPSELLSPATPEPIATTPQDWDSRPSSGFYSVSGSSLSDSCFSVSSEAAPGGSVKMGGTGRPHSLDHGATQWRETEQQSAQSPEATVEKADNRRPASTGDLDISGLMFLTDFFSTLCGTQQGSLLSPSSSFLTNRQIQLDPKFCTDLVSRKTKEVYPYPSPLHAVALQSPLFTSCQDPSPPRLSPSPENVQPAEPEPEQPPVKSRPPPSPSLTQLEQYISRLVQQYHSRAAAEFPGQGSQKNDSFPSHKAPQLRSGSSSSLGGGSVTPSKVLGNSARVSLSSIGKKASRNSINLGNLPSVTGEDFNISFHLNLNLNLNPAQNKSLNIDSKNAKDVTASCGHLSASIATPTASPSSSSSAITITPNWRGRPRISTCPSTVSNRGSLEITGRTFGPLGFSRSLDWSGTSREEAEGCPPTKAVESPPKLSEDSAVVCEISRVSGLPKSVVVGLMEEGVELDAECFTSERQRGEGSASPCSAPTPRSSRSSLQMPCGSDYGAKHLGSPAPNHWAGSMDPEQDYSSHQHHLHVTRTPQSGSPHSESERSDRTSNHSMTGTSPVMPLSHTHSDTASSPGSASHARVHSPPRLLSSSPFTPAQLTVFRRDSPSQCSLPRFRPCGSPLEGAIRPRGGSLRQEAGAGWRSQERGWRRSGDGERLYQGKHASRELIRASTVSNYSGRDYSSGWEDDVGSQTPKKGGKFWKGFETRLWGKEEDGESVQRGALGGRRNASLKETSSKKGQEKFEGKSSKRKGTSWDGRSSSLRLSRRALFRSESQGILEPQSQKREGCLRSNLWSSSFEISREGRGSERSRNLVKKEEKHLSSTASLFHLSRSQSLEGSCQSLSPLSSPSLSPSPPPPAPLTRSRSFRDLGRRVFGSMRSLSLKSHKSKK
ncbi:uncharacterized protein LOC115806202 [Chanos chanos]|uniref:Uncharacterized protein LOC115806202 n=1 Tax=Chanos chanos TaxID=29144 RepID=A0A6J2UU28_CHACN|nr:uncharacterized protein LOC115806202 [Chanos chanos]